jgi:UDP-N-acetylmuramate--alanine ligase
MKHKIKHIHFVGIGGSGMSGIAEVLLNLGYKVSGSDLSSNAASQRLAELGARVLLGHAASNIDGADAVVTSTAVNESNPEVVAARAAKVPIVPRAIMLGELMRLKRGIAIAGTHGKTTTTSLVASVLAQGGLDPTFVIGGRLNSAGANAKLGTGEYIVAEADESDASFLNLSPMIEVITNIDADHMDTYEHDFEKLKAAFVNFTHRLPFYGRAMLCVDDPHVRAILPQVTKPVTTYGFSEDAEVRALDARADGVQMRFTVRQQGYPDTEFVLNQPGMHNVLNACSAIAIAREIGLDDAATKQGLAEFRGVGRRFTKVGEVRGTAIIDDYAHNPFKIAAAVRAARQAYKGPIVAVVQPHRYTRLRDTFEQFATCLNDADVAVIAPVYAAGEKPIEGFNRDTYAEALRAHGHRNVITIEGEDDLAAAVAPYVKPGAAIIGTGAGSITGWMNNLPKKLEVLT